MIDHEAVFAYFTEEVKTHTGDALRSVTVYGSSLGHDFCPAVSDYNFLMVADPVDMALLDRLAGRMGKWRKKRISAPLIVSPRFLERAMDSYPLEFLSMTARHRVLLGDDPLQGLAFDKGDVRLQCERELRSKILLFRRAYMESEGAPRRLVQLVERGLPSLMAIFRGMIFLKDGPWRSTGHEFWAACANHLGVSDELLRELHALRGRRSAPARERIRSHIDQVLDGLDKLADEVDAW
jgi:hypothetical protein